MRPYNFIFSTIYLISLSFTYGPAGKHMPTLKMASETTNCLEHHVYLQTPPAVCWRVPQSYRMPHPLPLFKLFQRAEIRFCLVVCRPRLSFLLFFIDCKSRPRSSGLWRDGLRWFVSMNVITSWYFFSHASSWVISNPHLHCGQNK